MNNSRDETVLDFLRSVIKIESPSGNEKVLANFLTNFLKDHAFSLLPSKVGNVIGVKGKGSPILLLASHMDTVKTDNPFREDEDKIYGTGAVDCKSSLASMFFASANVDWKSNWGTLIIAGIVHEEDALIGIESFFQELSLQPDYAIFGEPTQIDRICLGYRGRILVRLSVNSTKCHIACSWDSDNTIEIILELHHRIQTFAKEYNQIISPTDGHFHELTANISTINGGQETNSLPQECIANIDIRLPPKLPVQNVIIQIQRIIDQYKQETHLQPETIISFETFSNFDACEVTSNNNLVNALRWAAFQTLQKKIEFITKTGSSFTNLIQKHYCIAQPEFICITYGPGNSRLEHTNNEYIEKEEFMNSVQIWLKFFRKFNDFCRKPQSDV
jgi:LysW-gamma-L-lysine carboxypeptidase